MKDRFIEMPDDKTAFKNILENAEIDFSENEVDGIIILNELDVIFSFDDKNNLISVEQNN